MDPANKSLTDPDLLKVVARRTFEAPGDGPLNNIGVAGDGSLVFSTDNNQLVKLLVETSPPAGSLALTQPTYNCATGAITTGGIERNGSSITFNAPSISRSSLSSNTGTVEQRLQGDPKPITIIATQSGNTVSYTFDFGAYCANPQSPQPPQPPQPPTGDGLMLLAPT